MSGCNYAWCMVYGVSLLHLRTDGNLSAQVQRDGVALAVSSLLGGLGSFRGKLLVPRTNRCSATVCSFSCFQCKGFT